MELTQEIIDFNKMVLASFKRKAMFTELSCSDTSARHMSFLCNEHNVGCDGIGCCRVGIELCTPCNMLPITTYIICG